MNLGPLKPLGKPRPPHKETINGDFIWYDGEDNFSVGDQVFAWDGSSFGIPEDGLYEMLDESYINLTSGYITIPE